MEIPQKQPLHFPEKCVYASQWQTLYVNNRENCQNLQASPHGLWEVIFYLNLLLFYFSTILNKMTISKF